MTENPRPFSPKPQGKPTYLSRDNKGSSVSEAPATLLPILEEEEVTDQRKVDQSKVIEDMLTMRRIIADSLDDNSMVAFHYRDNGVKVLDVATSLLCTFESLQDLVVHVPMAVHPCTYLGRKSPGSKYKMVQVDLPYILNILEHKPVPKCLNYDTIENIFVYGPLSHPYGRRPKYKYNYADKVHESESSEFFLVPEDFPVVSTVEYATAAYEKKGSLYRSYRDALMNCWRTRAIVRRVKNKRKRKRTDNSYLVGIETNPGPCVFSKMPIHNPFLVKPQMGMMDVVMSILGQNNRDGIMVTVAPNVLQSVNGLAESIEGFRTSIDASPVGKASESVLDSITSLLTSLDVSMMTLMFASLLAMCHYFPDSTGMKWLCAIFAVYVTIKNVSLFCTANMREIMSKWISRLSVVAQAGNRDVPVGLNEVVTSDYDVDTITELAVNSMSMLVMGCNLDVKDLSTWSKTLILTDKAQGSFAAVALRIKTWIAQLIDLVSRGFGKKIDAEMQDFADRVKGFSDKIKTLKESYNQTTNFDMTQGNPVDTYANTAWCKQVTDLRRDVEDAITIAVRSKTTEVQKRILMDIMNNITPMLGLAAAGGCNMKKRFAPMTLIFVGPPLLGKTYLVANVAKYADLYGRTAADIEDYKKNPDRHVYPIKTGQKYFDNYADQSILEHNDMFQATDAPGQEKSEAAFFINNVGSNPQEADCANANLKQTKYFKNRLYIGSSNLLNINANTFKSILEHRAVVRRMRCIWPVPKEQFRGVKNDNVKINNKGVNEAFSYSLDISKVEAILGPGAHPEACVYYEYDIGSGALGQHFEWKELKEWFYNEFAKHCEAQKKALQSLDSEFANDADKRYLQALAKEAIAEVESAIEEEPFMLPFVDTRDGFPVPIGVIPQMGNKDDSVYESAFSDTTSVDSDVPDLECCYCKDGVVCGECNLYATAPPEVQDAYVKAVSAVETLKNPDLSPRTHKAWLDSLSRVGAGTSEIVEAFVSTDEKFAGYFQSCIKCFHSGQVIPIYEDQPLHPYSLIASRVDYTVYEVDEQDIPVNDSLFVQFYNDTKDTVLSALNTVQCKLDSFILVCRERSKNVLSWICENKIITGMSVALVAVTTVIGLVIGLCCGTKTNVAVDVPVPGVPTVALQANRNDPFMASEVESKMYIKYIRKKPDGIKYERELGTFTVINDHSAIGFSHMVAFIQDEIKQGCTEVELYIQLYNNTTDTPTYTFLWEDLRFDHLGSDKCIMTWPLNMSHIFSDKRGTYLTQADVPVVSALCNGTSYDGFFLSKEWGKGYKKIKGKIKKIGHDKFYTTTGVSFELSNTMQITLYNDDGSIKPTTYGMCGGIFYVHDSRLRKESSVNGGYLANPIPVYIHTCGDETMGVGFGPLLTYEDFEPVSHLMSNVSKHSVVDAVAKHKANVQTYLDDLKRLLSVQPQMGNLDEDDDDVIRSEVIPPTHNVGAILDFCPRMSFYSNIKKSPYHADVVEAGMTDGNRVPVRNNKRTVQLQEGTSVINPTKVCLEKYGTNPISFPSKIVKHIGDQINRIIIERSDEFVAREPLTMLEYLQGEPGIRHKPRDDTACGLTFSRIKALLGITAKGRRWLWKNSENVDMFSDSVFMKALQAAYDRGLAEINKGQRLQNIFLVNLKDELRDIDKVMAGKSRIFCCQELVFLLLTGTHFSDLIEWLKRNRFKNFQAIGLNPHGEEWGKMYDAMKAISDEGIFGDHGSYDKELHVIWNSNFRELYHVLYAAYPQRLVAMDALFEDILNPYLAVNDNNEVMVLYQWSWGNSSGNGLTSYMNGHSNVTMMTTTAMVSKYTKEKLVKMPLEEIDVDSFLYNVFMACFGDDIVLVPSKPVREYCTFPKLRDTLKTVFNREFTEDDKTSSDMDFKPISKGGFLARSWREDYLDGERVVCAPLRFKSIFDPLKWDKSKHGDRTEKFQRALIELSYHGKDVHGKYMPSIISICKKHSVELPRHLAFEDCLRASRKMENPWDMEVRD